MLKILITGATGYIGSNLAEHLSRSKNKCSVYAMVRPDSNLEKLNLFEERLEIVETDGSLESVSKAVKSVKPDVVVHLAALYKIANEAARINDLIESNIIFGTNLLQAMVQNGTLYFVNTGTFWENMDNIKEYRPVNLYAAIKRAFEDILKYYEDAFGIRAVTLKLYSVYGPNDPREKIFSLFKESLKSDVTVELTPGNQVIDWVFIDDVMDAYEMAVTYVADEKKNKTTGEVILIGSGTGVKLRDAGSIYEECVGKTLNVNWGGRSYRKREVMHGVADIEPARVKIGWRPKFSLKTGISKMLEVEDSEQIK